MKKTLVSILMAMALLWVLPSCKQDENSLNHFTDNVVVTTAEPAFITGSTASCGAEVTADDAGLLIGLGVCWSKSANPTVDDNVMQSHRCSKPYLCLLTDLEPNTQYHVRGFAQYGTEYCYGSEKTFTTLAADVPAASPVTTLPAYEITYEGFSCDVTVEPFGATLWQVGVCYSQNPDFTFNNCEGYCMAYLEDDVYRAHCYGYGLLPNTQYYYRAFVAYGNGHEYNPNYFYGEILSFTMPDIPLIFELQTYVPYYWWSGNYINVSGYLYCSKPEVIDKVGFCYSSTNEYPQYESDFYTTVATPTGSWYEFQSDVYNISANTKYYFRTFVRYMTDSIRYGNVKSVYTN
jgi:hypothetical protein